MSVAERSHLSTQTSLALVIIDDDQRSFERMFRGRIKGSIFDHPSIAVRWDWETPVDASLHREESFAGGNVNRDMDVDKWGRPSLLFRCESLLFELNAILGMTWINNDDVESTTHLTKRCSLLVGRDN